MIAKPLKEKRCKSCKTKFLPERNLQSLCGYECAVKHAERLRLKRESSELKIRRKETKLALVAIKSRSDWIKDTQKVFNQYIRLRDASDGCISCNREVIAEHIGGAWDCGHFLSVGSHPELRFNFENAHKQCKSCNAGAGKYARKNYTVAQSYRINLIKKIGIERVEWLEGHHNAMHYTIQELIELKKYFQQKIKDIKSENL